MKELTSKQIASIKRVFLNNLSNYKRLDTIRGKIEELTKEAQDLLEIIDCNESGVKRITGGHISSELIMCEYVPQFNEEGSPKMDKEGKYQQKKRVLTFVQPKEEVNNKYGKESTELGHTHEIKDADFEDSYDYTEAPNTPDREEDTSNY